MPAPQGSIRNETMLPAIPTRPLPIAAFPKLCVPVSGATTEEILAHAAALLPAYPFQELRLDSLPRPQDAISAIQRYAHAHPSAILLATCRRLASGGQFTGSSGDELTILLAAAHAGCAMVDLALESAEALGPAAIRQLQATGTRVALSWHDFQQTPDLRAVLERMRPFAPDLYKIVPTARSLADNLALLTLLAEANRDGEAIVGIAMGEAGTPSRILGVRAGSAFTFAPVSAAATTAPGQLTADALRHQYHFDQQNAETRIYGVAGDPVRSSLSPAMLNTAFAQANVNAVYLPLLTRSAEELFALARALPLAGFSVTMPLKQAVLPFLDRIDPLAARIGAVNTVRREPDGSFSGYNTDAAGVTTPLAQHLELAGARILVVGAGGAARAAVFACSDLGAQVFVVNRTHDAAGALAHQAGATALPWEQLSHQPALEGFTDGLKDGPPDARTFDALIQATPAGMRGNPTDLPPDLEQVQTKLVFDMVYNPLETPLLRLARARGLDTISGLEMFVHQGAAQFELWTGQRPKLEAMRQTVLQHLV